jgi:hypothetical protein
MGKGSPKAGTETPIEWLGYDDKRALTSREIIEWLLSLPANFGDVNFIMFSFNYDVTHILAGLPREKVWEICKKQSIKSKRKINGPVFYGPYAMDYMKSKWLKIWRLRNPGEPYKYVLDRNGDFVMGDDGTPKRTLDFTDSIIIHDTFGFYQKRFTSVSKSLRDQGYLAPCDHETIVEQKDNRSNFDNTPL